jgi:hypothetical protein
VDVPSDAGQPGSDGGVVLARRIGDRALSLPLESTALT